MDALVGEIRLFAGTYATTNWHICDGTVLNVSDYQALFSLIGNKYGGDGVTTFALPNLKGRVIVNQGTATSGTTYPLASSGGAIYVQVAEANMPTHTHTFTVSASNGTANLPSGNYLGQPVDTAATPRTILAYLPDQTNEVVQPFLGNALSTAGGSTPHPNIQPTLPLTYWIALNGLYPQFS